MSQRARVATTHIAIVWCLIGLNTLTEHCHAGVIQDFDPAQFSDSRIPEIKQAAERFREGKLDEAFGLLQQAVELHPKLPPARFFLAMLYLTHNRLAPGRLLLEQACVERPDCPAVYLAFGQLALQQRRLTDASLHYRKVLSLTNGNTKDDKRQPSYLIRCHHGLATIAELRDDANTAAEQWTKLLTIEPKNSQARVRLARCYFRLEQHRQAFAQLNTARQTTQSLDHPAVSMARWFSQKQDSDQA